MFVHAICCFDFGSEGEAERRALSPTGVAHLSQNVLLPLLLEEAKRAVVDSCPAAQVHGCLLQTIRPCQSIGVAPSITSRISSPCSWVV